MISTVSIAVDANGRPMPGERRLYKTRKEKAVAHGLWPCSQTPGASAVHCQPGLRSGHQSTSFHTGRLCIKLSLCLAIAGKKICGI